MSGAAIEARQVLALIVVAREAQADGDHDYLASTLENAEYAQLRVVDLLERETA